MQPMERLKYFEVTLSQQDEDAPSEHWTPVIDMKEFREACFKGIPEDSGLRATAWKVLMGYLPPDKQLWNATLLERRLSYYALAKDLLEPPHEEISLPVKDQCLASTYIQDNMTLEQIDKDVRRTLPQVAFFKQQVPQNPLNPLSAPPPPSASSSLTYTIDEADEDPMRQSDTKRRFSFGIMGRPRSGSNTSKKSLKIDNNNLTVTGNRSRSNSRSSVRSFSSGMLENGADIMHSPRNIVRKLSTAFATKPATTPKRSTVKPICPYIPHRRSLFKRIRQNDDDPMAQDYHWEVIERLLYIYAKLNPGLGYVQGMNELLAPIYYVFANDPTGHHAEADSFFVFTTLMGDVRDHFVRSLDQDAGTGIHGTLYRLQQRLAWYDHGLWRELQRKNVKEPYYAFRWITVLFTQEWNLPDVIRLWDSLWAERGMTSIGDATDTSFEFLLDFAVAMLVCVRQELLTNDFAECIKLLQNYPINDIQYILTIANGIRETRLQMVVLGQVIPGVNDVRHSGIFNGDWSDTSSISSTTSTTSARLHRRLRESTVTARSSFDSFRRESKESMDDIFRRGIAASGEHWKRASTGDMKRSISQRLDVVKGNVLSKARRSGSVRSTNSESSFLSFATSTLQQQKQKHWLLANQSNNMHNGTMARSSSSSSGMDQQHLRNDIPHAHNDRHQRASSHPTAMLNRFSQLMVSGQHAVNQPTTANRRSEEESEKRLSAKAAAARDQALYYRTSPAYNGYV